MEQRLAKLYGQHLGAVRAAYENALSGTPYERVVIYGGAQQLAFLDDNPYPFKVNPHFKWWLPLLDNPHCYVVYEPGSKPVLVYYQPIDYWHKAAQAPEGYWVEFFEIRTIAEPDEARQHITSEKPTAFIGEWNDELEGWQAGEPNPKEVLDHIHFHRAWKTEYELECLRAANRLGATAHRAAERAFRSGASGYEIHLEYLRACGHAERELPYGNIIGLNENAAVLHYQHLDRSNPSQEQRYSLLIDAGANYNGYASDITRTYSNRDEFQELVDAVTRFQKELCGAVKPGVDYRKLHLLAHRKVADVLKEMRFVNLDPDTMVKRHITGAFLPHGLGHYIGLQVHDAGGLLGDASGHQIERPEGHPFLRLTRVVEEGHVFTIEPGIYFIDSLLNELKGREDGKHVNWNRVDEFRKFGGVRIEDVVAVTAAGHENMTVDAFASV